MSTAPRKVLGILNIVTEGVLPQLPNAASDDVLHGTFNARAVADLIDQLTGARV